MIEQYYRARKRRATVGGGGGGAVAQTWIYYYDGQTIKRRKVTDTAGSEIETVSSNATAIPTTLKSGIGYDFSRGPSGILAVGNAAEPDHLYEIDLADDTGYDVRGGQGIDWTYDLEPQPDINGGRWLFSDQGNLWQTPYNGGTATQLLSNGGNWFADDVANNYILAARESTSFGMRRHTNRTTATGGTSTIMGGIVARGCSIDGAGTVFFGDRTNDKLWKCQYHPTIGSAVELDAFTPTAIGSVDYVAQDDKVYYGVGNEIYSINPDGTGKTLLFDLGVSTWGAKAIYVDPAAIGTPADNPPSGVWVYVSDPTASKFKRRNVTDSAGTGIVDVYVHPDINTHGVRPFAIDRANNLLAWTNDIGSGNGNRANYFDLARVRAYINVGGYSWVSWVLEDPTNLKMISSDQDNVKELAYSSIPSAVLTTFLSRSNGFWASGGAIYETGATPKFVIATAAFDTNTGLRRTWDGHPSGEDGELFTNTTTDAVHCAADPAVPVAFYTDHVDRKIYSLDPTGALTQALTTVVDGATVGWTTGGVQSIDLDTTAQKLYYCLTDANELRRCDYNGANDELVWAHNDRFRIVRVT